MYKPIYINDVINKANLKNINYRNTSFFVRKMPRAMSICHLVNVDCVWSSLKN